MNKYADFDAALKELGDEPVRVKLFGQMWELYSELPAAAMVRLIRWEIEPERALSDAEVLDFIAELVPPEVLEAWLAKGLGSRQLGTVLKLIVPLYMANQHEDEGEPEGEPPKAPRRKKSSGTGASSRPTSAASTAST